MLTTGVAPRLSREVVASAVPYLTTWLEFRCRHLRVPGVQAAVRYEGELILSAAFGSADVERGEAMRTDHAFRVASHSKTFTATAVLQLVRAGRVRLDDPVGRWIPALASAAIAEVTVRDLLNHSGGVVRDGDAADFWQLVRPFPDEAQLLRVAVEEGRVQDPDVRFKYSNIAYGLLGLVIEAVGGRPFADHVRAELLEPLRLTRTTPELDGPGSDYVVGYSALSTGEARIPLPPTTTGALAAATGFCSTAEDLTAWAHAHRPGDDRVLDDAAKRMMQRGWWPIEGTGGGSYGLGWSVVTAGERSLLGHGGGFPGQITRTVFDPEAGLSVAVLTNAIDGPAEELALGLIRLVDLAAADAADAADAAEASPAADPDDLRHQGGSPLEPPGLDAFAGRFACLWGVHDVAVLGGRLSMLDPTLPDPTPGRTRLEHVDATTLRAVSGPGYGAVGELITYTFDAAGRVEQLTGPGGVTWWPAETFEVRDLLRGG